MSLILTFAEQRDGKLRRPSLEAVSEARRLADQSGAQVAVVLVGSGVEGLVSELASYGADSVHVYDDAAALHDATELYAKAVAEVITNQKPSVVLLPFTSMGRDLAPRVAARVGAGLVSDCVSLTMKDGKLEARRPMYAGRTFATVQWTGEPQMASLRPNVFALAKPDATRTATVVKGAVDPNVRAKVVSVQAKAAGKVELSEAQIIVSGGRGLKGPEHFHLVTELADAMGAAVGASRAIVDAGWVDHHLQVGQTGKTVAPTLYVACGISGAIQHLAGMSSSKVIVAINKDGDAPIFKVANYGIVGDVFDLIPRLTAAAKTYFASKH